MQVRLSSANTSSDSRCPCKIGSCQTKLPPLETLHVLLLTSVISWFDSRFYNLLSLTSSAKVTGTMLASLSHPHFKLK